MVYQRDKLAFFWQQKMPKKMPRNGALVETYYRVRIFVCCQRISLAYAVRQRIGNGLATKKMPKRPPKNRKKAAAVSVSVSVSVSKNASTDFPLR
jgi:hypothetical protein